MTSILTPHSIVRRFRTPDMCIPAGCIVELSLHVCYGVVGCIPDIALSRFLRIHLSVCTEMFLDIQHLVKRGEAW